MFDYELEVENQAGVKRTVQYQKLIRSLEIQNEVVCGAPMSEGGTPQAAWLQRALIGGDIKAVRVMFNGNQIL